MIRIQLTLKSDGYSVKTKSTHYVIFSLGVAFGIDYKKQHIGDVIASKRILLYNDNKRNESKIKPERSQDKRSDSWLHLRFMNANGFLDNITYGDILTGGSVLSSYKEKNAICLGYTESDFIIGGEMEGNALFQYEKSDGIPCAVIKGICDWGVEKNSIFSDSEKTSKLDDDESSKLNEEKEEIFKDSLQAFAMKNVFEKCRPLFHDKFLFATSKNSDINELKFKYKFSRNVLIIGSVKKSL